MLVPFDSNQAGMLLLSVGKTCDEVILDSNRSQSWWCEIVQPIVEY